MAKIYEALKADLKAAMAEYPKLPDAPQRQGKYMTYLGRSYLLPEEADRRYQIDCASVWKAIALEAMKYGDHAQDCPWHRTVFVGYEDDLPPCTCGWSALQAHVEEQAK